MRASGVRKEKLPIKNDDGSSRVDKTIEISNHDLIGDIVSIVKCDNHISGIKWSC